MKCQTFKVHMSHMMIGNSEWWLKVVCDAGKWRMIINVALSGSCNPEEDGRCQEACSTTPQGQQDQVNGCHIIGGPMHRLTDVSLLDICIEYLRTVITCPQVQHTNLQNFIHTYQYNTHTYIKNTILWYWQFSGQIATFHRWGRWNMWMEKTYACAKFHRLADG